MGNYIEDGTGHGYGAEVDDEHHLHTTASTEPLIAHRSHYDGSSFGISTPMLTITAAGGRMLYIYNSSSTANFWFTDFWFNWDGGTTNHNLVMFGQLIFGDTAPTVNTTVSGAGALNRSIATVAELTVLYWDEVGNGMTGHVAGTPAFYWCNGQGAQHYNVGGAIIIGTGDTLSVNLQGEEAGEASVNILGFFK